METVLTAYRTAGRQTIYYRVRDAGKESDRRESQASSAARAKMLRTGGTWLKRSVQLCFFYTKTLFLIIFHIFKRKKFFSHSQTVCRFFLSSFCMSTVILFIHLIIYSSVYSVICFFLSFKLLINAVISFYYTVLLFIFNLLILILLFLHYRLRFGSETQWFTVCPKLDLAESKAFFHLVVYMFYICFYQFFYFS